jgi:type IV fimbrial biogenesis protein FimT
MLIFHRRFPSGFTLVEVLVGLAIVSILMALGFPSYAAWAQSLQVRNAAEALQQGMHLARAEALRRNADVRLQLTGLPAPDWTITTADASATLIQSYRSTDGSKNAEVSVLPSGATTVTFGSLGQVVDTSPVASIDITTNRMTSQTKTLRLMVQRAGGIKVCDPAAVTSDAVSCATL